MSAPNEMDNDMIADVLTQALIATKPQLSEPTMACPVDYRTLANAIMSLAYAVGLLARLVGMDGDKLRRFVDMAVAEIASKPDLSDGMIQLAIYRVVVAIREAQQEPEVRVAN